MMIEKLQIYKETPSGYKHPENLLQDKINEVVDAVNKLQKQVKEIDQNLNVEQPEAKEIPNTEYVTITAEGVYVGGEPANKYNGQDIYRPYICVAQFKEARDIIREEYGYELLALHCLQSSTEGEYAETGNPVPDKEGTYSWVRAFYKDKKGNPVASLWAFYSDGGSAASCASDCAGYCCDFVGNSGALRVGLFGSVAPNDVNERDE